MDHFLCNYMDISYLILYIKAKVCLYVCMFKINTTIKTSTVSYIVEAATIETDVSYSKALLSLRFPGIILSTDSVE
jgi:hypothetical protein